MLIPFRVPTCLSVSCKVAVDLTGADLKDDTGRDTFSGSNIRGTDTLKPETIARDTETTKEEGE